MAPPRISMLRSIVVLSALLGACDLGEVTTDGGGSGSADRTMCVDRAATIPPAHNHVTAPTGARAGLGCIAAGCHHEGSLGAGATSFAFAGTAYTSTAGDAPATGATVRMFANGGMTSLGKAITDDAGNFVIRGGFAAYPYETDITACGSTPDKLPMVGKIDKTSGNCNAGGTCHANPGGLNPIYIQ